MQPRRFYRTPVVLAIALMCAMPLHAAEWMAIKEPTIAYDGPSLKSRAAYVFYQGTPVEIVVRLPQWVKVKDADDAVLWVERARLTDLNTVIVKEKVAQIYSVPRSSGAPVMQVAKGVLLENIPSSEPGWVQVRHRSGTVGYIASNSVWPNLLTARATTPLPAKP